MKPFGQLPTLFLHFFDIHFLDLMARRASAKDLRNECRRATRLSYLAAEEVLIPAASYFESELCASIIDEFRPVFHLGFIYLVGGGIDLYEFFDDKQLQYASDSAAHKVYFGTVPSVHPPFKTRTASATQDIKARWGQHLERGTPARIFEEAGLPVPKKLESNWEKVPERLGKRAFILDNILPYLTKAKCPRLRARMHPVLNEAYFESFTREYKSGVVTDMSYLHAPHRIPSFAPDLSYRRVLNHLPAGLLDKIMGASAEELTIMRCHCEEWRLALAECLAHQEVNGNSRGTKGALQGSHRNLNAMWRVWEGQTVEKNGPTIGILTALPHEYAAVEILLENFQEIAVPGPGAGRRYTLGDIRAAGGGVHRVVVAMLPDMGNNIAGIGATLLQEHFPTIEAVIMTGIAGGVPNPDDPENHVRLGDLVVSNRSGVIQYDNLKRERPEDIVEDKVRAAPRPPSARMTEAVRYLEARAYKGERPWLALIDTVVEKLKFGRPDDVTDVLHHTVNRAEVVKHPDDEMREPSQPRLFAGTIAAANILLKDPVMRDALRDKFGVKAVEMESSGVSDATWYQENGYLVVRAICDYCDMSKGNRWQRYAAAVAAGYTVALIASLPLLKAGDLGNLAPLQTFNLPSPGVTSE